VRWSCVFDSCSTLHHGAVGSAIPDAQRSDRFPIVAVLNAGV
jgi:hypothetical protein